MSSRTDKSELSTSAARLWSSPAEGFSRLVSARGGERIGSYATDESEAVRPAGAKSTGPARAESSGRGTQYQPDVLKMKGYFTMTTPPPFGFGNTQVRIFDVMHCSTA